MLTDHFRAIVIALLAPPLCACSGGEDTVPRQEIRVILEPTSEIDGVDILMLRIEPVRLTHDGRTTAVLEGPSTQCTRDQSGAEKCVTNAGSAFIDMRMLDRLDPYRHDPTSGPIVGGVLIDAGIYTAATLSALDDANVRDSYAQLTDGRECEVRLRSIDGGEAITFPMNLHIATEEDWIITLRIDWTRTQIDPARCADGYDVLAAPASASYAPNPHPNHG
jgi:hypothetical protein